MKILHLALKEGMYSKKVDFKDRMQFYSFDNTQGKTTAIRLILHALGFKVPNITGINLKNIHSEIHIENNGLEFKITRSGDNVWLEDIPRTQRRYFDINYQQIDLHTLIFGEYDIYVLENILGTFYIDQTKGGVVFNRGDIIGSIHFSVDKLIAGLQGTEITDLLVSIDNQKKELKKLKFAQSILMYKKEHNLKETNSHEEGSKYDEALSQIKKLEYETKDLSKQLNNLENAIISNNSFIDHIENYNLAVVNNNGIEIPVNKKTLKGFNNINPVIQAQKSILKVKIEEKKRYIIGLKEETRISSGLFEMADYQSQIDDSISKIRLDNAILDNLISKSETDIRHKQHNINEKLKHNSEVMQFMNKTLIKYAELLGVKNLIDKDGIKTNNIQTKSGTSGFKLIIAFKIAYILSFKRFCGIKLPLIIDSLRNNEVSELNAQLILKIVDEALKDHQIIIASIYKYPEIFNEYHEIKGKFINDIEF